VSGEAILGAESSVKPLDGWGAYSASPDSLTGREETRYPFPQSSPRPFEPRFTALRASHTSHPL